MRISDLKPETAINYRPDVDGLRAVAILSVLLFHAFPNYFPGGFVGVDVFFVISGFLITQIIAQGVQTKRFSYKTFYYRRARRLLPSLAIVLLAVALAAPFLLLGPEIVLLGKHILSGLLFTLNFRLTHEAGYFDTETAAKPLLHLWSLGVEEQFYLLWPLTFVIYSYAKQNLKVLVLFLIIVSFFLNLYFVNSHPSGTFYLPHTRFWQILTGALIAITSQETLMKIHSSRVLRNSLMILGSLALGSAFVFCDATKDYPGWLGLLPVVGSAALISAGANAWVNKTILASSLMIFIGYISYPLYLWHWPILSYLHIVTFGQASTLLRLGALAISVVLASTTFYFIELPLRQKRLTISVRGLLSVAVLVAIAGFVLERLGESINPTPPSISLHAYLTNENVEHDCYVPSNLRNGKDVEYCMKDRRETPKYVVWGDSKADAIYAGLVTASSPGKRWALLGRSGCTPAVGVKRGRYKGEDGEGCLRSNRLILNTLLSNQNLQTVLVTVANRVLFTPTYTDAGNQTVTKSAGDGLIASLKELLKAGKQVGFLVDNPTLSDPEKCVPRPLPHVIDPTAVCSITIDKFRTEISELSKLVERIRLELPQVKIIDATDILCAGGVCNIQENGTFLYGFSDHLSDEGATRVARKIISVLN